MKRRGTIFAVGTEVTTDGATYRLIEFTADDMCVLSVWGEDFNTYTETVSPEEWRAIHDDSNR